MVIMDNKELFEGDRLALCSDEAQLHWPRLYAAANNFARLDLNYRRIISFSYAGIRTVPTEEQFWTWIEEYRDNFMLFIYKDGEDLWGHWQNSDHCLPRYKTAADRRSPEPPAEEEEAYRQRYAAAKAARARKSPQLAKLHTHVPRCADAYEVVQTCSELSETTCAGIGTGIGVGTGIGIGKNTLVGENAPDPAPSVDSALSREKAVEALARKGWSYFLEKTGRTDSQYQYTRERIAMGRRGFESLVSFARRERSPRPEDCAAELFEIAVDRLVASPFHNGTNESGTRYTDWHQLFRGKGFPAPTKLLSFWLDDTRFAQ